MSRAHRPNGRLLHARPVEAISLVALVALVVTAFLVVAPRSAQAATEVGLGTAGSFAVLAGSTITNTGSTTITGDVGLHPGSDVDGFDDVTLLGGELHVTDEVARQAKDDLVTAYDDAAGQEPRTTVETELGGQVLTGGVYTAESGTFEITDTLTLDAQGIPGTVWVFQAATTLVTATDSEVLLINGADPCNVFWQVGSSATLGTGTTFAGTILALESITLNSSATIVGRALARDGATTMDTNTINTSACTTPTTDPDPDPTTDPDPDPTTDPDGTTPTPPPTPAATTGGPTPGPSPTGPEPAGSSPPTSGTPQVPTVPTGPVPAGDGSILAGAGGQPLGVLLVPPVAALVLFTALRRRQA